MFERIPFTHTQADTPLTSRHLSREAVEKGGYDPDNIMNAEFWIMGSTESFLRPPITDFARDNLFHMQTFDLFHYKKGSFTRRKDYRSYLLIYTYSGTAQLEYSGRKYTLNPNIASRFRQDFMILCQYSKLKGGAKRRKMSLDNEWGH